MAFHFVCRCQAPKVRSTRTTYPDSGPDIPSLRQDGGNAFEQKLPRSLRRSNVTLKRFVVRLDDPITHWIRQTLNGAPDRHVTPKDMEIALIDTKGRAVSTWQSSDAYPVRWVVADVISAKHEVGVEAIECTSSSTRRS